MMSVVINYLNTFLGNTSKIKASVNAIKAKYPDREVYYVQDFEDIVKYLSANAEKDDIVMTMGAGDVYKIGQMMLEV